MPRIPVAQRRRDFIEAAVEVIATHGIDGATTRRIAEEAKANVAMLHYCYDSKEDLFTDVYQFVAGRYREVIEQSNPHSTVQETAVQLLRGAMDNYVQSPNFAAATLELFSWARRQHGDRGIAVYDEALGTVREVLQEAAGDRPLDAELVDDLALVIATLSDGFAVNWYTYGDQAAVDRQMEVNCSVLEAWLATRLPAAGRTRRRTAASAR